MLSQVRLRWCSWWIWIFTGRQCLTVHSRRNGTIQLFIIIHGLGIIRNIKAFPDRSLICSCLQQNAWRKDKWRFIDLHFQSEIREDPDQPALSVSLISCFWRISHLINRGRTLSILNVLMLQNWLIDWYFTPLSTNNLSGISRRFLGVY